MTVSYHFRHVTYDTISEFQDTGLLQQLAQGNLPEGFPFWNIENPQDCSDSIFMDRESLCRNLIAYNRSVGNSLKPSLEQTIRTDGQFIIAGQQPGLLTGPLYTFLKALTVVSLAQRLEGQFSTPVIPAFWIASDDHDLPEVNRFYIRGKPFICSPGNNTDNGKNPPVGDVSIEHCKEPILRFLSSMLPDTHIREWVLDLVSGTPFKTYGKCFGYLLKQLFRDWDLVMVDARSLLPLSGEILAVAVQRWKELETAFQEGTQRLESLGYRAPLDRLNLFRIEEKNRAAVQIPSPEDQLDLSRVIRSKPHQYSPGAALRSLVQDGLLPVCATIGGPTELLYLWQVSPLYRVLEIRRSNLYPRISATFLEPKTLRRAAGLQLYPDRIFDIRRILNAYPPPVDFPPEIVRFRSQSREFRRSLTTLTENIQEKWAEKIDRSIQFQLDKLFTRLADRQLRQSGWSQDQLEWLASVILPAGTLQERQLNVFHFLGRYGSGFIDAIVENLNPEQFHHYLVEICETVNSQEN
jgi:bacillithiol synthase